MPAFYAHYRFGKHVADRTQGQLREIIDAHRAQFEIGLQGPDIFFFYRPHTGGGKTARYGHHLHEISAKPFFEHSLTVLEKYGRDSGQYAYLLGFICHFALDGACHPYIGDMIKATGVHHLEIEEEFEKFLLREDGRDPVGFPLAELVPTDRESAEAAAPFYSGMTVSTVKTSLQDLKRVKSLLTAPGVLKQGAINTAMKLTGKYASLKGLMNQRKDNPKCREINQGLAYRFDAAVEEAKELMRSFDHSLVSGELPDERFDRNFL